MQNSTETALIYSRGIGRNSVENHASTQEAVHAVAVMTDRCYFRDQ